MAEAPRTTSQERLRRQRNNMLIVGGVLAVLAAALAYVAWDVAVDAPETATTAAKPPAAIESQTEKRGADAGV